jgi:aspartate-semialdehyde dehydrogenase
MSLSVAVVGATGAVGREMLAVLEQRKFPASSVRAFATPRSAGTKLPYHGGEITVEPVIDGWHKGIDCALLSAGSSISKAIAPAAAEAGVVVIDNSSAFRMNPNIPLVVPEINSDALPPRGKGCIIANPNCSAIILLMGVTPLHRAFGVDRMIVSTYQAASGAGAQAMAALEQETREVVGGGPARATAFHEPYAFNLFSHNATVDPITGLNGEEQKVIEESRKIWNDHNVRISVTCVRVPVMRAHCESVNVTLKNPATLAQVRDALKAFHGVTIVDDRLSNRFPTPQKASGGDDVLVGRLRADPSQLAPGASPESPTKGFDLFLAGDQLRKGAALNAVQIAERMFL